MPAILSTLRLEECRVDFYVDKVDITDMKSSGSASVPLSYEAMFNLNKHKKSILDQLRKTELKIKSELKHSSSKVGVDALKAQMKSRFNRFPNRVEIQLTQKLALFIFVDFFLYRRNASLSASFAPKIMSFSRAVGYCTRGGTGIFPLGKDNGGIEQRPLRIGVLKEFLKFMPQFQRTLFDYSVAHGHASGCPMCRFVIGDSTTLSSVRLPASLKNVDVQKCKKDLDRAFWHYLNEHRRSIKHPGSLIIVMRPYDAASGSPYESIESSEDEADYEEVICHLSFVICHLIYRYLSFVT